MKIMKRYYRRLKRIIGEWAVPMETRKVHLRNSLIISNEREWFMMSFSNSNMELENITFVKAKNKTQAKKAVDEYFKGRDDDN